MMSSADRTAWLETLIVALSADASIAHPVTADMIAACERHLRDNSRSGAIRSQSLH